ncbi:sure-like protein, partial [Gloeophyllum trabeum ATCC 11539]
ATNILLTNDDGWAVAMIRAQNDALKEAGYNVVLSCPAENKSGTGSSTATPTTLTEPCEYDTCPTGSPPEGFNASDPTLNYVNAYPADSAKYGIQTLGPKFFGGKPDFVVSGPNVGNNLGNTVQISGTVGAACEAALEGVPSVSFSGSGSDLAQCAAAADYQFVLTRILADASATDVETCGTDHLPAEGDVVGNGCYVSVSVYNASTKADVDAATQGVVLNRFGDFLTCYDS